VKPKFKERVIRMKKKKLLGFLAALPLLASVAANAADPDTSTSRMEESKLGVTVLQDEVWAFRPQLGALEFDSPQDNSTQSRAMVGFTFDINLAKASLGSQPTRFFAGPSFGLLYSHVGTGKADFFGSGAQSQGNFKGGGNVAILPVNVKLGFNVTDTFRVSARAGGHLIYRSAANVLNLGTKSNTDSALWRIYPNAGGDFEVGLSRKVSLMIRPDLTITPEKDLFTGTLGISALLG
jgi:hypothetical protein